MKTRRVKRNKRRTRKQKVRKIGGTMTNSRTVYNRLGNSNNADLKTLFTQSIDDVQSQLRGDGSVDCGNIYIFLQKLLGIIKHSDFKTRIHQGAETIDALKKDTEDYCFGINISHFMYDREKLELLSKNSLSTISGITL
jgi:hypothetical protein